VQHFGPSQQVSPLAPMKVMLGDGDALRRKGISYQGVGEVEHRGRLRNRFGLGELLGLNVSSLIY